MIKLRSFLHGFLNQSNSPIIIQSFINFLLNTLIKKLNSHCLSRFKNILFVVLVMPDFKDPLFCERVTYLSYYFTLLFHFLSVSVVLLPAIEALKNVSLSSLYGLIFDQKFLLYLLIRTLS